MDLSEYEHRALREISEWKRRAGKARRETWSPPRRFIPSVPLPGAVVRRVGAAAQGVLDRANAAAQSSLRRDLVLERLRRAGHEVERVEDLVTLDLQVLDACLGPVRRRYVTSALAEGAAAGSLPALAGGGVMAAQAAAFAADTAILLGASLRAVGEILAHYGVDVSQQQEQVFALRVLGLAAGPSGARAALIHRLSRLGHDLERQQTWTELERQAASRSAGELVRWVAFRLAQRKLAQLVPLAGGVVGASTNAVYMSQACEAGRVLGRERFLLRKQAER